MLGWGIAQAVVLPPEQVQPTADDWKALIQKNDNTKQQYSNFLNWAILTPLHNMPHHYGSEKISDQEQAMRTQLEQARDQCNARIAEVEKLDQILRTLPDLERTRERFLQLRQQAKNLLHELTVEKERQQLLRSIGPGSVTISNLPGSVTISTMKDPAGGFSVAPRPQGLQLNWQDFPNIDGSTTAQPLAALMACRFLGLAAEWEFRPVKRYLHAESSRERILRPNCCQPVKLISTINGPLEVVASATPVVQNANSVSTIPRRRPIPSEIDPGLRIEMEMTGTDTAYQNLIDGRCDLILVARPPSADELADAKDSKVELESATIGYDAFIFILNAKNPIDSLTVKQIQAIYHDDLLRWSELGGDDTNIIAFQRERNSGSQETMESLVMKGTQIAPADEMLIGMGMGGPYNQLFSVKNGIGYTFYYYQMYQSPDHESIRAALSTRESSPGKSHEPIPSWIKVCAVNGIKPTAATIADRSYPFITDVYAVIRKNTPPASSAVRLRDWLLTPEGQALVKESGYVPLR